MLPLGNRTSATPFSLRHHGHGAEKGVRDSQTPGLPWETARSITSRAQNPRDLPCAGYLPHGRKGYDPHSPRDGDVAWPKGSRGTSTSSSLGATSLAECSTTSNWTWLDHFRNIDKLSKWLGTEDGAEAVRALWARDDRARGQVPPDDEVIARIRAFSSRMPADVISGAGVRLRTISVLLMALDAERYPPFKTTELNRAYARVGYTKLPRDEDEGTQYEHTLRFFDGSSRSRRHGDWTDPATAWKRSR